MTFQFRKEAIEEDLNSNFPSQGQGNPPLYYSLSDVVVPTYSINNVAEGSALPRELQQAWDFSTGFEAITNTTSVITNTPGFYKIDLTATFNYSGAIDVGIFIFDGVSVKYIWRLTDNISTISELFSVTDGSFVVFLRSGDSLRGSSTNAFSELNVWYRQIATVNGTLVNPLGYSAA